MNGDPAVLRAAYVAERAPLDETAPADVAVSDELPHGLSGLAFTPPGAEGRAPILYFHGGSWMLGSPGTHRALCAFLAKAARRRVLSVSYPLAPEHPYPAQPDAAQAALAAFEEPVFIAGDSAGGAMALWAAQADTDGVLGVATFYPAYGVLASSSIDEFGPDNIALHSAAVAAMYARLGATGEQVQADVPHKGAPVLIIEAECDPLRDDARLLADHMAGRGATLWTATGEEHAFLHHGGNAPEVREWMARIGKWMDELAPEGSGTA
ncbi:MAG: alpha/beta hydrolase [Rhodobacteraceae bacterium]|nr:alpha/beta hydrolase [Paracoccaceae bacterium]